jgi:hypothetical protein
MGDVAKGAEGHSEGPPTPSGPPRRWPAVLERLVPGAALAVAGLAWLLRRGYQGWLVPLPGWLAAGGAVYLLVRAAQVRAGIERRRSAVIGAVVAALVLGVAAHFLLSPWYLRLAERRAWGRYAAAPGPARERWDAYARSVPPPFRRPEAEVGYLLDAVRDNARRAHVLRWILDDVRRRYGDDPAFEPVRQSARQALDALGGS